MEVSSEPNRDTTEVVTQTITNTNTNNDNSANVQDAVKNESASIENTQKTHSDSKASDKADLEMNPPVKRARKEVPPSLQEDIIKVDEDNGNDLSAIVHGSPQHLETPHEELEDVYTSGSVPSDNLTPPNAFKDPGISLIEVAGAFCIIDILPEKSSELSKDTERTDLTFLTPEVTKDLLLFVKSNFQIALVATTKEGQGERRVIVGIGLLHYDDPNLLEAVNITSQQGATQFIGNKTHENENSEENGRTGKVVEGNIGEKEHEKDVSTDNIEKNKNQVTQESAHDEVSVAKSVKSGGDSKFKSGILYVEWQTIFDEPRKELMVSDKAVGEDQAAVEADGISEAKSSGFGIGNNLFNDLKKNVWVEVHAALFTQITGIQISNENCKNDHDETTNNISNNPNADQGDSELSPAMRDELDILAMTYEDYREAHQAYHEWARRQGGRGRYGGQYRRGFRGRGRGRGGPRFYHGRRGGRGYMGGRGRGWNNHSRGGYGGRGGGYGGRGGGYGRGRHGWGGYQGRGGWHQGPPRGRW